MDRLTAEQLKNVYVSGPNNQLVPLSTIATVENRTVPRAINRFQQFNAVTLSGVPVRFSTVAIVLKGTNRLSGPLT